MGIRDTARMYLLQVPPVPAQITSNGPLAALFTRLSGIRHIDLLRSWGMAPRADGTTRADTPPGLTSCNGFVGIYGNATGISDPNPARTLGQFLLDKRLQQWGKGFAWIPSTAGARPKFGDIFIVQRPVFLLAVHSPLHFRSIILTLHFYRINSNRNFQYHFYFVGIAQFIIANKSRMDLHHSGLFCAGCGYLFHPGEIYF